MLISDGETLALARGTLAVCLVGASATESARLVQELSGALDPEATVVLPLPADEAAVEAHAGALRVSVLAVEGDRVGPVQAANAALAAAAPADVLLLVAGARLATGAIPRIRSAALSDSTLASATPLSLGLGDAEMLDGVARVGFERAAQLLGERDAPLWPRIATAGPAVAYLRRQALELVGPLQPEDSLAEALAAWALRASSLGMLHVLADDVLVDATGAQGSVELDATLRGAVDEGGASAPHPPVKHTPYETPVDAAGAEQTIASEEHTALERALARGRLVLSKLTVTIDGRALSSTGGGTYTYIRGVVLALASAGDADVRVLTAPGLADETREQFSALSGVTLLDYDEAVREPVATDVVHRPQQAFTLSDLALLRLVGRRVVIGQQDLIGYHNPSYHADLETWQAYRRTTRLALGAADQVVFFSEHARGDALGEDLLPRERTHVVGIGADDLGDFAEGSRPRALAGEEPYLLCLGADYAHKNRPFAIALLAALRDLGWHGRLVLAGAHVPFGSSRADERVLLGEDAELAGVVHDLGHVSEGEKLWLYANAAALVFPTVYEGYGLLPLEAARAGVPCLFAAQASLDEIASPAATLVPWDARASARAVEALLRPGPARDLHLAALRALAAPSWSAVAQELLAVYEHAVAAPASEAATRAWQELARERHLAYLDGEMRHARAVAQEYQDAYHDLFERVAEGLALVDRDGLLTPAQQRGLKRLTAHQRIARAALAPFGFLGGRRDS